MHDQTILLLVEDTDEVLKFSIANMKSEKLDGFTLPTKILEGYGSVQLATGISLICGSDRCFKLNTKTMVVTE